MKDGFNRVVATGLLALMIANISSCNTTPTLPFDEDKTTNTGHSVHQSDHSLQLSGDVWDSMRKKGYTMSKYYPGFQDDLKNYPLPIRFLQEQGIVYFDDYGRLQVQGNQPNDFYEPLSVYAYIDNTTSDNDVYLLMQYQSGRIIQNTTSDDVYLATWKLKYTLDDDDYETFLELKDDFRQRYFIQEMDNMYQPEIVAKTIAIHNCVQMGSNVRTKKWPDNIFPHIYIDNIDYENYIITFGAKSTDGYRYYDVSLYESHPWNTVVEKFGITEQQKEDSIKVETINTPLGDCLSKFQVFGIHAGVTEEIAKQKVKESTRLHELEDMKTNSIETNYEIAY